MVREGKNFPVYINGREFCRLLSSYYLTCLLGQVKTKAQANNYRALLIVGRNGCYLYCVNKKSEEILGRIVQ